MFTSDVHVLFSPRLLVVISGRMTRLTLLLEKSGGGWIGGRSLVDTLVLSGRVSAALKMILPYHHDASGALSSERKAWCGVHLSRSTTGVSSSGSIGARPFGRETIRDGRDAI
jgi:hypothetical protein